MMISSVILLSPGINDLYVHSLVIPVPNGKNGNITDSANYRGIALSSVYGKLFDLLLPGAYSEGAEPARAPPKPSRHLGVMSNELKLCKPSSIYMLVCTVKSGRNAPQVAYLRSKIEKFFRGGGTAPSPDRSPVTSDATAFSGYALTTTTTKFCQLLSSEL